MSTLAPARPPAGESLQDVLALPGTLQVAVPLAAIRFSRPVFQLLIGNEIATVNQLAQLPYHRLRQLPRIGPERAAAIEQHLRAFWADLPPDLLTSPDPPEPPALAPAPGGSEAARPRPPVARVQGQPAPGAIRLPAPGALPPARPPPPPRPLGAEVRSQMQAALGEAWALSARERAVLGYWYGLDGGAAQSAAQIGRRLEVSRARAIQLVQAGWRRIYELGGPRQGTLETSYGTPACVWLADHYGPGR